MLLNEVNLINRDQIYEKLTQLVNHKFKNRVHTSFDIQKWFTRLLMNLIDTGNETMFTGVLDRYNANHLDPEWMHKDDMYFADTYLLTLIWEDFDLDHVVDYIAQLPEREQNKLYKLNFKQLLQKVVNWDEEMEAQVTKAKLDKSNIGEVIIDFKNGYKFIKLNKTEDSYKYEGNVMGHCVGSNFNHYQHSDIYSLRDKNNEPHATIEVKKGGVYQIKGKNNKAPIPKYIPYIETLLNKLDIPVYYDGDKIGWNRIRTPEYEEYYEKVGIYLEGEDFMIYAEDAVDSIANDMWDNMSEEEQEEMELEEVRSIVRDDDRYMEDITKEFLKIEYGLKFDELPKIPDHTSMYVSPNKVQKESIDPLECIYESMLSDSLPRRVRNMPNEEFVKEYGNEIVELARYIKKKEPKFNTDLTAFNEAIKRLTKKKNIELTGVMPSGPDSNPKSVLFKNGKSLEFVK